MAVCVLIHGRFCCQTPSAVVFQTWWCISCLVRADGLESMPEAVSVLVVPHERQKRIVLDHDRLIDEKPTTWYQSAQGTAKSKLVMSLSIPHCLIACVGFCILGATAASPGGSCRVREL